MMLKRKVVDTPPSTWISTPTLPVPPYGVSLDNHGHFTHQTGNTGVSSGPAYFRRWGYVPPYLRTSSKRYAHMTDGRVYKQSYFGEVPFRQVVSRAYAKQVITSPGKTPNKPQYSAQDVLVLQALQRRGYLH